MPNISRQQYIAMRQMMPAWEIAELLGRDIQNVRVHLSRIKREQGIRWPDFPRKCRESPVQTARRTARSIIVFEEDAWNDV